jgi:hypothetical protein
LNCSVPTDVVVKAWNAIEVVFDAPKNAVPVGTVAGVQLAAVLKFELPGAVDHVASCARAGNAASNATAAVVVSKCARIAPPPGAETPEHTLAAKGKRKLGRAPTSGRNFKRVAETSQSPASLPQTAGEGAGRVCRARSEALET